MKTVLGHYKVIISANLSAHAILTLVYTLLCPGSTFILFDFPWREGELVIGDI